MNNCQDSLTSMDMNYDYPSVNEHDDSGKKGLEDNREPTNNWLFVHLCSRSMLIYWRVNYWISYGTLWRDNIIDIMKYYGNILLNDG